MRVKGKKKKKKKKKGKALRSWSRREASFRRDGAGRERSQGWVHQIPVSIREALRAFGSAFSCLLPCGGRSFCSSSSSSSKATNAEEGKGRGEKLRGMGSCGAAFARWLMVVEESEEGKGGKVVCVVVEEIVDDPDLSEELKLMLQRLSASSSGMAIDTYLRERDMEEIWRRAGEKGNGTIWEVSCWQAWQRGIITSHRR